MLDLKDYGPGKDSKRDWKEPLSDFVLHKTLTSASVTLVAEVDPVSEKPSIVEIEADCRELRKKKRNAL